MKRTPLVLCAVFGAFCLTNAPQSRAASAPRVFYAGGAGSEKINCLVELPDKTVLAAGVADDLSWLPSGTPTSTLGVAGISNAGGNGRVGFLMQLSGDLGQIKRVVALPKGAAQDLTKIKLSAAGLFVSGATTNGYFLTRLDGNFAQSVPTKALWTYNVWATGDHQTIQPWDVGSDGKVVFVTGEPFGANWCAVERLGVNGAPEVVPHWRTHWNGAGQERRGDASTVPGARYSAVVFKPKGRADLRSWNAADYGAVSPDGQGGTRKGKWPLDAFFNSPANSSNPGATASGPGYTGYRLGRAATARVVGVAVSPQDGSIYLGFSLQSVLPDGSPDFEPGVVAFDCDGALKWWSRLYTETPQNSSPDQYVDGLAVDGAHNSLVVLARCHGNNTYNLWSGKGAFQNRFTGTNGNIHISWLGKLNLGSGLLSNSTYVAEYTDGMEGTGAADADPNLDGWPDHNAGWPRLNTTRCSNDIRVDGAGRVYVAGVARRTITTKNAFQKMPKKAEGVSAWNSWARVYSPDFKTLVYSSLLTGQWDKTTGAGADNTQLATICPTVDGLLAAGASLATGSTPVGNPMPTLNVPSWAQSKPKAADAILARLPFNPTVTTTPTLKPAVVGPSGGRS